jgi:hypothetical protein
MLEIKRKIAEGSSAYAAAENDDDDGFVIDL